MNQTIITAVCLCLASCLYAQNGKIIDQAPYQHPDTSLDMLLKRSADFKEIQNNTSIKSITYVSDGLKIKGYLVQPKQSGKYPCVIFCRGGNRDFSFLSSPQIGLMQTIANWGYVVIGSQNRGCCGSEGNEEFGGADINDVLNLLQTLEEIPNADTSRVGIYGISRGGMMAYLALKKSNRFKAAIINSGLSDLFDAISSRPDGNVMEDSVFAELIPNYKKNKNAALKARSANFWADSLCKKTPILIMHGSSDWRVNPDASIELLRKLYLANQPVKYIMFPGSAHGLGEYRAEVLYNIKMWLDDFLKNNKPLPDMKKHGG